MPLLSVMNTLRERFTSFRREDSGQDLIEYAVIVGLIALSSSVLLPDLRDNMRSVYSQATVALHRTATGVQSVSERTDSLLVRAGAGLTEMIDRESSRDRAASSANRR